MLIMYFGVVSLTCHGVSYRTIWEDLAKDVEKSTCWWFKMNLLIKRNMIRYSLLAWFFLDSARHPLSPIGLASFVHPGTIHSAIGSCKTQGWPPIGLAFMHSFIGMQFQQMCRDLLADVTFLKTFSPSCLVLFKQKMAANASWILHEIRQYDIRKDTIKQDKINWRAIQWGN